MATLPQLLSQPQPVAMPQFILTSGQLVQGIQGAQLLIPTSQGKSANASRCVSRRISHNIAFPIVIAIPKRNLLFYHYEENRRCDDSFLERGALWSDDVPAHNVVQSRCADI